MKRKNLRSKEWFDNPKDPGLTALYLERYLNYGLKKEDLQFKKDLLLKQLEEQKSQLTLRRVAVGRLNMTTPSSKNLVFIKKTREYR